MPPDRKSTRLNSSHTEIYTLSLHDALPIYQFLFANHFLIQTRRWAARKDVAGFIERVKVRGDAARSEEHTSELQSHRDLHSFPTRRSSDLPVPFREPFFDTDATMGRS